MSDSAGLRQRKQAAVRGSIYRAAMELFAEQGYDATAVEVIAERAGVSRATFFNHFGTKEGVLRYYGEQLQESVEALVAGQDPATPALERLRQVLYALARAAEERRMELQLIYRFSMRNPSYPGMTPARQRIWALGEGLIAEAQAAGAIRRDMAPRELAMHILGLAQNVVLAHVFSGEPVDPLMDSAWKLVLGGVCHDPAAK